MRPLPRAGVLVEWSYRISLFIQGFLGVTQSVAGLGLWFSPSGTILRLVDWLVRNAIASDPADPVAARIIGWAAHLGPGVEEVYRIYLLGHGALNLFVVTALLLRIRWAFHAAIAVLGVFVVYQGVEYVLTGDPALLAVTLFDLLIISLVLLERRQTRPAADPAKT